jgi:hypothetical protein
MAVTGFLSLALVACGSSARSAHDADMPTSAAPVARSTPDVEPTTTLTSAPPSPQAATTSASPVRATTPSVRSAPPAPPSTSVPFSAVVTTVSTAQLGASWHAGCPVGAEQLRQLTVSYWGFDATPHTGILVVNASVTSAVTSVFRQLYNARFPIRSIRPTADYGGSDPKSMAADNTSAFNCRLAVTTGPAQWSVHAYGEAIDVNTVENPYLEGGTVMPPAGAGYTNRGDVRPGMAVRGGTLINAFAAVGWPWGGRWSDPDYQHFSATGG